MRTLFLSSMCLFHESRFGGAKRLYYYARELQRLGDLHLVTIDGCREVGDRPFAPPEFPNHLYLPVDFRPSLRRALGAPVDFTPELRRHAGAIESFLGLASFDAVLVGYSLALSFLGWGLEQRCKRVVYQEDDLMLERYRKAAVSETNPLKRAHKAHALRRLRTFFDDRLARADAIVTISPEEQRIMRDYFPRVPVEVLSYGIPLEEYPMLAPPADRAVLGFIGNFGHLPNREALAWLLDEIYPGLKRAIPGLRLVIAGKGIPVSAVRGSAGDPTIRFMENVGHLEDFYRGVGVVINPVRTGRGLRTKLIEAAAFGRPIVSTRLGAEGLDGLTIGLADSVGEMRERCLELLQEATHRETAQANRRAVQASHSLSSIGRDLGHILMGAG